MVNYRWRCLSAVLLVSLACVSGHRGLSSKTAGRSLSFNCPSPSISPLRPTVTYAPIVDLVWVGKEDTNVFAVTRKAGLDAGGAWRSADGGNSFSSLTEGLNSSIHGEERINIMNIFSQKSSPGNVLFQGTGSYMWLSHDFGNTFNPVRTPAGTLGSGVTAHRLHPIHDNWLLMLVKRPDCKSVDKLQMECPHDLWVTMDLYADDNWQGKWQNLSANARGKIAGFVDFDWGVSVCPSKNCANVPAIDDKTIFATKYEKPGSYDQPWDPDVDFAVSTDFFKSFSTHVRCGNAFEVLGHAIYLAFANSCPTDINGKGQKGSVFPKGITLYTSTDAGATFTQACLPIAIKQEGYELLETHDGTGAIIIVDYLVSNMQQGSSVYTAGPHHALFSLSLTDVYHADFGLNTDFSRIEGLPGVYMANQMLPRYPEDPSASSDYDGSGYGGSEDPLVESRITFNGGGHWQRLNAPTVFQHPAECNRCNGASPCYLHLHGMSSWDSLSVSVPAIYSSISAPGLIMSTGNVGPAGVGLDDNDGLCTWLSSDGGMTWTDVAPGAWIYEYADWGGIIVIAPYPGRPSQMPADEVRYSLDYGRCWVKVPLSTALLVDNIRIEPDGQRPRVLVHGRACRKSSHPKCSYDADDHRAQVEGLTYVVDVKALAGNLGQCSAQDYEPWNVATESFTPRCVLGQTMQFQRRRQDSTCLNGGDYVRPPAINGTCNCTQEDIECDYGFMRTQGKCAAILADKMPSCPVISQNKYAASKSGKRLLHGDVCSGIGAVIGDTDGQGTTSGSSPSPGPKKKTMSGVAKFFIVLAVFVACGALFIGWWRFAASQDAKDTFTDIAGSVAMFFSSVVGWFQDKIRNRRGSQGEELGYFQPLGDAGQGHDLDDRPGGGGIFTLK